MTAKRGEGLHVAVTKAPTSSDKPINGLAVKRWNSSKRAAVLQAPKLHAHLKMFSPPSALLHRVEVFMESHPQHPPFGSTIRALLNHPFLSLPFFLIFLPRIRRSGNQHGLVCFFSPNSTASSFHFPCLFPYFGGAIDLTISL